MTGGYKGRSRTPTRVTGVGADLKPQWSVGVYIENHLVGHPRKYFMEEDTLELRAQDLSRYGIGHGGGEEMGCSEDENSRAKSR